MTPPADSEAAASDICRVLEWDSAFFGRTIARAVPTRFRRTDIEKMIEWGRDHGVDCIYVLADLESGETIRALEDAGGRLVDVRVTLARDLAATDVAPAAGEHGAHRDARDGVLVRRAAEPDIVQLRRIAGTAHRQTRFHADPRFDPERCDELYRAWIENSCRGYADQVLLAESGQHVLGYVTLHVQKDGSGSIGLIGVDDTSRRQGVGRRLLSGAFAWLAARGARRVSVITQGRNVSSQAFYQDAGFRTSATALWYHLWLR